MVAATLTLLAAAAASPASAEPGNGADVVNESDCYTEPDYGTFCYDARSVSNTTETPSGNLSYVANARISYEFTGSGPLAGCNDSGANDFKYHGLVKDETLHELGIRSGSEFSGECFGNSYNCTFKDHFHYANGKVQFSRPEFECTP